VRTPAPAPTAVSDGVAAALPLAGRRVLVNALAAKAGGFRGFMIALVHELRRRDDGARYLILLPAETAAAVGADGPRVRIAASRTLARRPWVRTLWEQAGLPLVARRWNADTIVSGSSYGPVLPGRRHMVWLRNSLPFSPEYEAIVAGDAGERRRLARARWQIGLATRNAWRVVVQQDAMIARVRRYLAIPPERFCVVPNAPLPPAGKVRPELVRLRADRPGAFIVNGCQYYHRYRNIETLLDVAERVASEAPDLLLLLAVDPREEGEHSARFAARLAASPLSSAGRVVNLGRLTPAEMHALYRLSDVAVFPSLAESFSNAYLDALAAGCAIAASNLDFARVVFGDAALYFDPRDATALARLLEALRAEPAAIERARARARARATEFSWERTWRAFVAALA
jgi:glycosyltransferase involved in cell wall biosynthesis